MRLTKMKKIGAVVAAAIALLILIGSSPAPYAEGAESRIVPAGEEPPSTGADAIPVYGFEIVNVFPHDRTAFTQGLEFHDGVLFESTGINGSSSVRKVDLKTGKPISKVDVPEMYFAEGLTVFKEKVFQLTWTTLKGFTYDAKTLSKIGEFSYNTEGWGLTHDAGNLILSDGSNKLYFLDPETMVLKRTISVVVEGRPLRELNELEYVNGEIYANIWHDDRIVRIDPASGRVLGWINLTGLIDPAELDGTEAVLNGIAYDGRAQRLFVTGKRWPKLFEIRLKPGRTAPDAPRKVSS